MESAVPTTTPSSPERWLEDHGDALYGYAFLRLRDRDAAEDLVQETLLAALGARQRFAGDSSERTWLVGILKHKISDHWRRRARQPLIDAVSADAPADTDDFVERLFDPADGHWRVAPSAWDNPEGALEQQQFWQVLTHCIAALPESQARAFSLCEVEGFDGGEACKVLSVAPTNLWVLLHRARLRLRECLENHWFKRASEG